MEAAHLDVILRPHTDGGYEVALRFQASASQTDAYLIDQPLPRVSIDVERLLQVTSDPLHYGQQLTEMLFADQRLTTAFNTARTHAEAAGVALRFCLRLDASDTLLHGLRWETLHDPERSEPLFASERIVLVRAIESANMQPITLRPRGTLTALVVVAAPTDLAAYDLTPIDADAEARRCHEALHPLAVTELVSTADRCVTIAALRTALNDAPDILYLVCHGTSRMGRTFVWLQDDTGKSARIEGDVLVRQIAGLTRRPLLVILAACQSAGEDGDVHALAAIGPQLAREGVAAVVSMLGNVTQETIERTMPLFFRTLLRDGRIDRAIAAARGAVLDRRDWWSLTLLLRLRDGRLWLENSAAAGDSPPAGSDAQSRRRVLQHVRDYWIDGVLEHSLHGAALIALGIEERPEYVVYPWDMVVERAGHKARSIPPGTSLDRIFEEFGNELLILGTPGSGKTTMLLDLARALLERAERDPNARMPVVLHLSLWAENHSAMSEWVVHELEERYGIAKTTAEEWVKENRIILLFDGLDEVKLEQRNPCIVALNDFWKSYGAGMAVCSRIADYEALTERLRLRGAVLIQPLSDAQITAYLERGGAQLTGLREVLPTDLALRELAESPLLLSMMTLAYQGRDAEAIRQTFSNDSRQNQLFTTYVQRMLTRPRAGKTIAPQTIIDHLSWLARGMVHHSLSVFYLDDLQPTWITSKRNVWLYGLGSSLLIICFGLLIGYLLGAIAAGVAFVIGSRFVASNFSLFSALMAGGGVGAITGGLAAGLHLGIKGSGLGLYGVLGKIYRIRRSFWDWKAFREPLHFTASLRNGIVLGSIIGLSSGLLAGHSLAPYFAQNVAQPDPARSLNWVQQSANSLLIGLSLAISIVGIGALINTLQRWTLASLANGRQNIGRLSRVFFPLDASSIGGIIVSFVLTLCLVGFLTVAYLFDRSALSILLGLGSSLLIGTITALYFRFVNCSKFYKSERAGNEQAIGQRAAQRLKELLPKLALLSIVSVITCAILAVVLAWTLQFITETTIIPFATWVATSGVISFSLVNTYVILSQGGKSFLQLFLLRLILATSGGLPFRANTVLEQATERILLRRAGSGYLFIHRLVLEYFAALSPNQTDALLGSLSWALIDRGNTLRELDQPEAALEAFTQVLTTEPGNYTALANRAMVLRDLKRYEESLADLDRAIAVAYNNGYWARVYRGITLRILKRYDEALEELSHAIKLDPKPYWALIERSITYRVTDQANEAIVDATEAISLRPTSANYRYHRALAYKEAHEVDKALADLNLTIEYDSTDARYLTTRGEILRKLGRHEEAIADLTRATELDPAYFWAHYQRIETLRELRRYPEALALSDQLILKYPNLAGPHGDRGKTLLLMKEYELALASFTRATEIDPDYLWAYYQTITTLSRLKRYNEALALTEELLTKYPDNARLYVEQGEIYNSLSQYERALASFTRATELDPDYFWAHYQTVATLLQLTRYDDALSLTEQLLIKYPNNARLYLERGEIYNRLEQFEAALASFTRATEIDPESLWPKYYITTLLNRTERYEEALARCNEFIQRHPGKAGLHGERGETYLRLKAHERALADFTTAIDLQPDSGWAYRGRGVTLRNMGRYDAALADLNVAVEQASRNDWIIYQRGLTYWVAGDYERARSDFVQAIVLAQTKQVEEPGNQRNILNLVIYLLANGQSAEALSLAKATLQQSVTAEQLQDTRNDLTELRAISADHPGALELETILNQYQTQ